MRHLVLIALLLLSAGAGAGAGAQTCRETAAAATRFVDNGDGTLLDRRSGLQWQRCSAGQRWVGQDCRGRPQAVSLHALQAPSGWRLPSLQELTALAELACHSPAIDLRWFPHTPAGGYWTQTAFASEPTGERVWQVNFIYGEGQPVQASLSGHVRWVREALSARGWRGSGSPASAPSSDRD